MAIKVVKAWTNPMPRRRVRGTKKRVPRQAARRYKLARIRLGNRLVNVRLRHRSGNKPPIVVLPGLACSQADFARIFRMPELRGHRIISFDYPGQFRAPVPKGFKPSLESLVELTKSIFDQFKLKDAIIVGHSMGGIIGTLFAEKYPELVGTLISLEGRITQGKSISAQGNRDSNKRYLNSLPEVYTEEAAGYGHSLREHYESGNLLGRFFSPRTEKVRKVFVYGSDHRGPWREQLKGKAELVEIPDSGHFMFEDNPPAFFRRLAEVINKK